jgi:hypothetical protein
MPRYRHIVYIANRELRVGVPTPKSLGEQVRLPTRTPYPREDFYLHAIVALHQGNYATIPNYLRGELRYMDAGE